MHQQSYDIMKDHINRLKIIMPRHPINIPPEIIGHIANLRMISAKENLSKNKKCSITVEQLYERINLGECYGYKNEDGATA